MHTAGPPWSTSPMHITIRPLDLSSDAELEQYRAVSTASDDASYGGHEEQTLDQMRTLYRDTPYWRQQRYIALVEQMAGGSSVVGTASLLFPLTENLETVHLGITTHPAFRGQGIATAMLEQALAPAIHGSDRTLVTAWGEIPAHGEVDDPALPVNRLAARLGLSRRNVSVCRLLPLPVEDSLLDALEEESRQKRGGYRIELWQDQVPQEHLGAYGQLLRQMALDEPDEDVEEEPAEYTPERIRLMEQRRRESGGRALTAVAVAPDGSIVGNSEVHVQTAPGTTIAWQENTLVMPEHRGHGLGLALKVATHRLLSSELPEVRSLVTFNSHVNPWMIGINERLGYRIAFREIAFQGRPDLSDGLLPRVQHETAIGPT